LSEPASSRPRDIPRRRRRGKTPHLASRSQEASGQARIAHSGEVVGAVPTIPRGTGAAGIFAGWPVPERFSQGGQRICRSEAEALGRRRRSSRSTRRVKGAGPREPLWAPRCRSPFPVVTDPLFFSAARRDDSSAFLGVSLGSHLGKALLHSLVEELEPFG
jgi:hypothetical protein